MRRDDHRLAEAVDELALIVVGAAFGTVAAVCLVLALGLGCVGVASCQPDDVRNEAFHH